MLLNRYSRREARIRHHPFFCPASQGSAVGLFDSCLRQEISARDYTLLLCSEINLVGTSVLSTACAEEPRQHLSADVAAGRDQWML